MTEGYAPPEKRPPLLAYTAFMAIFNVLFSGALLIARRQGRELPQRPAPGDVILVGVAAHKLSRLIGKDKVTSPLRAPFPNWKGGADRASSRSAPAVPACARRSASS
jgi:Protein of unknown function (DUF1360)